MSVEGKWLTDIIQNRVWHSGCTYSEELNVFWIWGCGSIHTTFWVKPSAAHKSLMDKKIRIRKSLPHKSIWNAQGMLKLTLSFPVALFSIVVKLPHRRCLSDHNNGRPSLLGLSVEGLVQVKLPLPQRRNVNGRMGK